MGLIQQTRADEKTNARAEQIKDQDSVIYIAVIDVGVHATPPSFAEIFWVSIGEIPGIGLVEREQVDKLLEEQRLSISFGRQSNSPDAVKVGEVLGADALLILEAGRSAGGRIPVRLRLVETRFGMKYLDSALLLDRNEINHPQQASEVAERLRVQLAAVRKSEAALFVGVGTFLSEELTRRWNWSNCPYRMAFVPSILQEKFQLPLSFGD
ncbi:MAG: hypothetical protein ACYS8I_03520 [Planctomycetota bacterium]